MDDAHAGPADSAAVTPWPSSGLDGSESRRVGRGELLALLGITLLAALLRFWRLGELPPGIHVDEAFNLLDAREVLAGWRPVFLPARTSRALIASAACTDGRSCSP